MPQPTGMKLYQDALHWRGQPYRLGAESRVTTISPGPSDCCLVGDSVVYTTRGPVNICDVVAGDLVWTWDDGTLRANKVTATLEQPTQEVFRLRTPSRSVRATANHPFLALTRSDKREMGSDGKFIVRWSTEWRRLDELKRGDYIVSLDHHPLPDQEVFLLDGTPVDEDVAELLGLFVGDGWCGPDGFSIAVFGEQREYVTALVERVVGKKGRPSDSGGLTICSARWRDNLAALGLRGVNAYSKRVPEAIKLGGPSTQRAFLRGYAMADGHLDKRGHQSYASCSRDLLGEVRALHIALGDAVSNLTETKRTRPIFIKGKRVKNARSLWSFAWYPAKYNDNRTQLDTYGMRRAIPDTSFSVQRIASIESDGREPTWDIEVEGAHNFVAEGLVVHNSELVETVCRINGVYIVDGAQNQYQFLKNKGLLIPVSKARGIVGALGFRINFSGGDHVVFSDGHGGTMEARGRAYGCNTFSWDGRFNFAALIDGVDYSGTTPPAVVDPIIQPVPPPPTTTNLSEEDDGMKLITLVYSNRTERWLAVPDVQSLETGRLLPNTRINVSTKSAAEIRALTGESPAAQGLIAGDAECDTIKFWWTEISTDYWKRVQAAAVGGANVRA